MASLDEGEIVVSVPGSISATKFDDKATHGLSHCMKAVDFIFELADRWLFVEIKDPDARAADPVEAAAFLQRMRGGSLDRSLTMKFRDSFLYRWGQRKIDQRPIDYLVLVAAQRLTAVELMAQTDKLRRDLPSVVPATAGWRNQVARSVTVLNLEMWQRTIPFAVATRRP